MADLNDRQRAAVDAGPIDLFVSAGAGSGKTRVLSARFVSAVRGEHPYDACSPGELLAVTFTEKAAAELSERIRRALSASGDAEAARAVGDAWISTIHGMCSRILRRHAFDAGVDSHFRVLDQIEASALEEEALEEAVRESLDEDSGAVALFDTYGFEAVTTAAREIRSSVSALGMTAADVDTVAASRPTDRLAEIAEDLRSLASEFGSLRALKTVESNAGAVRRAVDALEAALAGSRVDAEGILADVTGSGLRCLSSVGGLDELVGAARVLIADARECAAQLAVGAHETALLSFIRRFELRYAQQKVRRGALDFEDLQVETARLLETHSDVAEEYMSRFRMLMVDEFQDTNALQLRIAESISRGNLCTVGDENQSIYAFRHADVEVFRDRAVRVPDARQLDINYRMAPALLDVVNGLFSHPALLGTGFMALRPPVEPAERREWPSGQPRFEARFVDCSVTKGIDPHEAEAECIAERVAELLADGVEPGEIAVLMRALAGGRAGSVERALQARGIPVYLASGGAYFDCTEIMEARALLRVINNVWDDAALTTVLAGRLTGVSSDGLVAIRECADRWCAEREAVRRDAHLWEALVSSDLALDDQDRRAVGRTVEAVVRARRMRGVSPLSDSVLEPLLELDADVVLFASGAGGPRAWANVAKLARLAAEYETAVGGDLGGFLEYLEMRQLHAKSEQEATLDGEFEAVRIMSIHAAKGLEFPVVIVGGLGAGRDVPGISVGRVDARPLLGMVLQTSEGPVPTLASTALKTAARAASSAEAIRLFYVGCTRAQEALTVVARTNPANDADDSLAGVVRDALGCHDAETLRDGDVAIGSGFARVTLFEPVAAGSGATAARRPAGGPVSHGEDRGDHGGPVTSRTHDPGATPRTDRKTVPPRVSYTGLATYGRCPYRFYLTSIARLPAPPAAQGGAALVFGSAVHAALERCTTREKDPAPQIAAAAVSAGLDAPARARLDAAVRTYLSLPVAGEVFATERVMREAPIAVPIEGTVLAGAADIIAWSGDVALIVDYKTGTRPLTAEEARDEYTLQGQCYALAALAAGASCVRVVFAELERGREISYEYPSEDLEVIASTVGAIIRRMSEVGFPALDAYEENLCETCPGLGGMCRVRRPPAGAAV